MSKIVSSSQRAGSAGHGHPQDTTASLYARATGGSLQRKYLNHDERGRLLAAAANGDARCALFVLTLAWTGARVSEVLSLTPLSFQVERSLVAIVTLKRRRWSVREIPIPPDLMAALVRQFSLARAQQDVDVCAAPLWPMSRVTAWRHIKRVMLDAGLSGRAACPRGLRHAFGVGTLQAGVPITVVQRWLGHARLTTTAIYADVSGAEETAFAVRFWEWRSHTSAAGPDFR